MKISATPLQGVLLIEPRVFGDARGFFLESFERSRYATAGIEQPFVQDNHSRSRRGVLRGLHYQLHYPQGKLVRVARGAVYDVAVDIRRGSPQFGQHYSVVLDDESLKQIYIPPGFAHGFCVLSEVADFEYKCTDIYHPEDDGGILWNDPALGIAWPIAAPSLSPKDERYLPLNETPAEKLPVYEEDVDRSAGR